jgi:hypothetical protein
MQVKLFDGVTLGLFDFGVPIGFFCVCASLSMIHISDGIAMLYVYVYIFNHVITNSLKDDITQQAILCLKDI